MGSIIVLGLLALIALGGFIASRVGKRLGRSNMTSDEYDMRRKEINDNRSYGSYDRTNALELLEREYQNTDSFGAGLRRIGLIVTAAASVLLLIVGFFTSFTTVPTKEVGVVTSFGKPVDYLPNGPHLVAPWQDVTIMDATIQTDTHNREDGKAFDVGCVKVRIAHQIVACANVYVKWQIVEEKVSVERLFQNYRDFDNIRNSLVTKNLQTTLNEVFQSYDPLAVDTNTGQSSAPELSVLSKQTLTKMQSAVGDKLKVSELGVTVLNYDDATQAKINSLQGQVAQTRIAEQAVKTAEQQAEANKKLAASVSKDPNVLVSKCLDMVESSKVQLPAGFSCWPGSGSAVVVPSASSNATGK